MNIFLKNFLITTSLLSMFIASANLLAEQNNRRSVQDVIRRVLIHYPTAKIARLEIERSRQEFAKIKSQLGWVVAAQTGVSRDISVFNIPSKRFDVTASVGATQKSGNSVEIVGQYSYENSEIAVIPSVANPSERTTLDLNYRIPLGQGDDNPAYQQGMISAEAGLQVTEASRVRQIDELVQQTLSLYYDAATTYMRIQDANEAIHRATRLLKFVQKNMGLGLSETKDFLIVEAQRSAKISERDILLIVWSRQRSELNRLLGVEPGSDFVPVITIEKNFPDAETALGQVYAQNPDILLQVAQLKTAASSMELANDAKKDRMDLVFSVGARNTTGDTATGGFDQSEWAGAAKFEYQFSMDQQGFDAGLYQAMLDKMSIEEEITRLKTDLKYNLNGLFEQIDQNLVATKSLKQRLAVEKKKVDEAFDRYKVGRADTKELIDNENSLFAGSLLYETRKIELARKYSELELLLGSLWDRQLLLNGILNKGK